jgi:heme exporter protein A
MDEQLPIHVRGLTKRYGTRSPLADVSFDAQRGECLVFVGANGAGKTTLLRCLSGSVRPTAGEVQICGHPVTEPAARRALGVVAHESRLYAQLTLRENLVFAARMYDLPAPGQRADELLEQVDLWAHARRRPTQVSRGMRQRVALAQALIHEPPVLLLDEPFAHLDARSAAWLFARLKELRAAGRTLGLVLHDQQQARALADRILELRGGRVWEVDLAGPAQNIAAAA